jgi:four helix bundle protein
MATLRNFRDLTVWQRAMDLLVEVYAVTAQYPGEERFGLAAHTRRSAVSIPSNIAEGYSRRHRAEYNRHLDIAYASAAELQTQIIAAHRLGFLPPHGRVFTLLAEVERMLAALRRRLHEITPRPLNP